MDKPFLDPRKSGKVKPENGAKRKFIILTACALTTVFLLVVSFFEWQKFQTSTIFSRKQRHISHNHYGISSFCSPQFKHLYFKKITTFDSEIEYENPIEFENPELEIESNQVFIELEKVCPEVSDEAMDASYTLLILKASKKDGEKCPNLELVNYYGFNSSIFRLTDEANVTVDIEDGEEFANIGAILIEMNKNQPLDFDTLNLKSNELTDMVLDIFYQDENENFPQIQVIHKIMLSLNMSTSEDVVCSEKDGWAAIQPQRIPDWCDKNPPPKKNWIKIIEANGHKLGISEQYENDTGTCYAFAVSDYIRLAAMIQKGQKEKKEEEIPVLAHQELLDCVKCGSPNECMQYIEKNGICTQKDYGKADGARDQKCRKPAEAEATFGVDKYNNPSGDIREWKNCLSVAPLVVGVYASKKFKKYGRFRPPFFPEIIDEECPFNETTQAYETANHALMAIGYKQLRGKNVLIVQNSWGEKWGHGGFAFIEISSNPNKNPLCLKSYQPIMATVKKFERIGAFFNLTV